MTVVSDSSPLITLARISYLHLLPKLYPRVIVSKEVYMEVAVAGVGLPGATQVSRAGWIDVVPARNSRGLELVTAGTVLGAGEVSTVLLAKELSAEVVLIDESRARRFAKTEGLTVIGCIGILEVLHRRGDLPELRAAYLRLLEKDIRIDVLILQQSLAKFNLPPL